MFSDSFPDPIKSVQKFFFVLKKKLKGKIKSESSCFSHLITAIKIDSSVGVCGQVKCAGTINLIACIVASRLTRATIAVKTAGCVCLTRRALALIDVAAGEIVGQAAGVFARYLLPRIVADFV